MSAGITWKRHDNRSYIRVTKHTQAFVFGATRPVQMWAWAVYWRSGVSSGVEQGFYRAKKEANLAIREFEERAERDCASSKRAGEDKIGNG